MMRLRAKDTVHISSVQSDNLIEGDEFDLDDAEGQKLVDRGIAEPVGKSASASAPTPSPAPTKDLAAAKSPRGPKAARQNKGAVATQKKD
jgi:hypothetical protein